MAFKRSGVRFSYAPQKRGQQIAVLFFVSQAVLKQPEICKAGGDGSEAAVRHIRALSQPKSSGIASRCATGVPRLGMVTLCEFRVSASSCHFDRAKRAEKSSSTWKRTKRPPNVSSAVLVETSGRVFGDLCRETPRRRLSGRGKITIFVSTEKTSDRWRRRKRFLPGSRWSGGCMRP